MMRLVSDSSLECDEQLAQRIKVEKVPLTLFLEGEAFRDDETLDIPNLLKKVAASKEAASSACPSPKDFYDAFVKEGSVFCVTMTAALSGTYNSARLARQMVLEEVKDKVIHIFDSKGSSIKETLLALKIQELIDAGLDESTVAEKAEAYLSEMVYFFQLGNLDTLIKNGRISKFKGKIATALNIKPILYATEEGEIDMLEKVRSDKKAMKRMVELVGEFGHSFEDKVLGISHCNALEKAQLLKERIEERYPFREVIIQATGGLSSIYVNEGGVTISF